MSSETTITPIGNPPPRRMFQVITRVDKDTLRIIERKRGTSQRKRSKSEATYLLIQAGIEADRQAEVQAAAASEAERRTGEDRRASA